MSWFARVVMVPIALAAVMVGGGAAGASPSRSARVPAGFEAISASFIDTQHGWALGSGRCGQRYCTVVLRTTDAGRRWNRVGAPPALLGVNNSGSVDAIQFVNRSDGFAFGNGLWTTVDAGQHWRRQHVAAGIKNPIATAVEPARGDAYAIVDGTDPRYGGGPDAHARLVKWQPHSASFSLVKDFGADTEAELITTGNTAFVLVEHFANRFGHWVLYRAEGQRVARLSFPSRCGVVAARSTSSLLAECGDGAADGSMGQRSLRATSDAGRRWRPVTNPGRGSGYDDDGLAYLADGRAVVATYGGDTSSLRETTDNAATWQTRLARTGATFSDLRFIDRNHGYLVANAFAAAAQETPYYPQPANRLDGSLFATSNGTLRWHRIYFR